MTRRALARIGLCLAWLALGGAVPALAASSPDGGAHPFVGMRSLRWDGFDLIVVPSAGVLVSDHVMVTSAAVAQASIDWLSRGPDHHVLVSFDEIPLDFQDPTKSFVAVISAAADAPPPTSRKDPIPVLGVLILDVAGAPPGVFIPSPALLPAAGAVSTLPRKTPMTTVTYKPGSRVDFVFNFERASGETFTLDIGTDPVTGGPELCGSLQGGDSGATVFMPGTSSVAAGVASEPDINVCPKHIFGRLDTAKARSFLAGYGVPIP